MKPISSLRRSRAEFVGLCVASALGALASLVAARSPQGAGATWLFGGAMSGPRTGASATPLPNGEVLLAGGSDGSGPLASAERLAVSNGFAPVPSMGTGRSGHAAVALGDGRVLVLGGLGSGGAALDAAELYDPATGDWTAIPGGMGEPRAGASATLLADGRVLVGGGESLGVASATLEIYDPATNAFALSSTLLSSERKDHAAVLLGDGRVLFVGGTDGASVFASTEFYDPSTDAVSPGPPLSTPRAGHSATRLLDGRVLVAGGSDGISDLASVEVYHPAAGAFGSAGGNLAAPRSGHLAFLLPHNNAVLIVGGTSGGADLASAELFLPWSGALAPTLSLASARSGGAGCALADDGLLLVAGGSGLDTAELYPFATIRTDADDYAPGDIVTITGAGWQPGEVVTLVLQEVPTTHPWRVLSATADSTGNLFHNGWAPEEHDLGVRFFLTAYGFASQAQITFTDANKLGFVTVGAPSPDPVAAGNAATFTVTVLRGDGPGSFNANLTVTTGLPAGASASFSPNPVSFTPQEDSKTSSLTISTTAGSTASGDYPFTVKASRTDNSNDSASGSGTLAVAGGKEGTSLSVPSAVATYGGNVSLSATLTKTSDGSGIATKAIAFTLNGTSVGSASTDASGVATLSASLCSIGAGNYAGGVGATFAEDSSCLGSSGSSSLAVHARPVDIAAVGKNRLYGDANPALTAVVSGLAAACGDALADVGSLAISADACSGVGSYAITFAANGAKAGNYSVSFTGANLSVDPRPVTIAADPLSKTYGEANPALTAQVSGLAAACGDVLVDVGSLAISADACSGVGSYAITFDANGAKAGNYAVSFTGANLSIDPRPVTIAADALSKTYGDPNPELTAQVNGLAAACGDALADVGSLAISADACSGVGSYAITFDANGAKVGNYAVSFTGANLTVDARPVSIVADAQAKTYGDANPVLTAQVTGLASGCGDTLASVGALAVSADDCSGVGAYGITFAASGAKAGNYAVSFTGANLTVDPRPVSIVADALGKTYGDANPALTAQVSGLAAACADDLASVGSLGTAADACSGVGAYAITFDASGLKAGNYSVSFTGADLTVDPRPVSIVADALGKTYGDANPALTAQASGLAAGCGDTLASVGSLAVAANDCSGVGAYAITFDASGPKAGNYSVSFTGADLTVDPRPVSIVADALGKTYGDGNPALTAQVSGLASGCGDTLASVGSLAVSADDCSGVGAYAITFDATGPKVGNYSVSFTGANLTVDARPVSIVADALSKTYGDANPVLTAQVSGLASACGDVLADLGSLAVSADDCSGVGAYAITFDANGLKAGNYSVSFTGADLTVDPRPVSIVADALSKTYGDGNPVLTAQVSGLASACGDVLADVGAVTVAADDCSGVGAYAITFDANGAKAGNYSVSFTGADLTVDARPVSIVADALGKTYGDANPALTAQVSGLASACGDNLASVGSLAISADACSGVGSYAITFDADGPKAGNYSASFTGANLAVTPRPITITVDDKTKVLNAPLPSLTAAVTSGSLVCGDAFVLSTTATQTSGVGPYPITAAISPSASAGNYLLGGGPGSLLVQYAPPGGACGGGHVILQPINANGTSVFKKGSTVPAKFRVYDANCVSVGPSPVVTSFTYSSYVGTPSAAVNEEPVSESTNNLGWWWDSSDQQWHFNINTKSFAPDRTYLFNVTLNDGSVLTFQFGLKK
ncbi:MAG TPA: MBG domain-containing protein [Planctomycetota bacterium]|nr:MBG domain-containing protein [Planctomycetota bacterium]